VNSAYLFMRRKLFWKQWDILDSLRPRHFLCLITVHWRYILGAKMELNLPQHRTTFWQFPLWVRAWFGPFSLYYLICICFLPGRVIWYSIKSKNKITLSHFEPSHSFRKYLLGILLCTRHFWMEGSKNEWVNRVKLVCLMIEGFLCFLQYDLLLLL
jgi:hypothetical protein